MLKKVYTSLLVDLVTRPPNLRWTVIFGELLIWIIELGVVAGSDLLDMRFDSHLDKAWPASIFALLAKLGNIDWAISNIEQSQFAWIIITTTTCALALNLLFLYQQGKKIQTEHDQMVHRTLEQEWRGKSLADYVLFLYGYIFYPVFLIANASFLCSSQLVTNNLMRKSDDLPVLASEAEVFFNAVEKKYDLVWRYDSSQKCFSALHIIMSILGVILHFLNSLMLIMHHRVAVFYPNPSIHISKRNKFWLLHPFSLVIGSLLKNLIITFKWLFFLQIYFRMYSGIMMGLIIVDLLTRPYYSRTINIAKVVQKASSILIGAYIFYARAYNTDQKFFFLTIVVCLTTASSFTIKLMITGGFEEILPHTQKFTISNLNIGDVIYRFEHLKARICSDNDTTLSNPHIVRIVSEFYNMYYRHKQACTTIDCFCKEHGLELLQYKLDRLFGNNCPHWFTEILYITNGLFQAKYDYLSAKNDLQSSKFLNFLRLWAMFSMENFGNTSRILTVIRRVEDQNEHRNDRINEITPAEHTSSSSSSKKLVKIQWNSIEIAILRKLASDHLEKYNTTSSLGHWESAFGLSSNTKLFSQRLNANIAILCINRLAELSDRMQESLTHKFKFVQKLTDNTHSLVQHSRTFLESTAKVDHVLDLLSHCKLEHSFRLNFLEIFFYLFIREDLHEAWVKLKSIDAKILTSNMLSTISFEGTDRLGCQMIFVGVSGEQGNYHTINHITVNIEQLGFSASDLINKDLKSILPNFVSARHKTIMSPSVPRQHLLQKRGPYQLYIKEASGLIREASVAVRTNSSLHRGLEYLAFTCFSTSESTSLFLVVDNTGTITDVNTPASRYFTLADKFFKYNQDLATFMQEYKETVNLSKCKPLPFASASMFRDKGDLNGASMDAEEIFGSWFILPIRPQKQCSSFQPLFKAKLAPLNFKELEVSTFSLQLEKLNGVDFEIEEFEDEISPISNLKLELMPDSGSSLGSSSVNIKCIQEKKNILKNAQQTDEYKMHSTSTHYRTPIARKEYAHKFIPLSKKTTAVKNQSPETDQFNTVRNCTNSIFEKIPTNGFEKSKVIAENEKDKEKEKLKLPKKLHFSEHHYAHTTRQYFGPHLTSRHSIRISHFIHNKLLLSTSLFTRVLFVAPFLLHIVLVAVLYYHEFKSVKDFQKISTEIAILDSNEYLQWVCKLHLYYVSLTRMYFDGKISDTQFNKFGYNGTRNHLAALAPLPVFPSQLTLNLFRMSMKLQQTNYWHLHDNEWLQRSTIKVKVYDQSTQSFSFQDMSVFDAGRDMQRRLDVMFSSTSNEDYLFGVRRNRSESIDEVLVSYNAFNPLANFFDERRH